MSAPIGSSTTAGSAHTRVGSSAGASVDSLGVSSGGSRPQVQSRRVSLKLGPLGITYSTDKVLWTEAVAAAAASAVGAEQALAADKALASDAEPVDPVRGLPGSGQDAGQDAGAASAQQTAQQEAAAAGRSFHLELAEAWRKQIEARAATSQTYGPDGAPRNPASSATTATTTSVATASATPSATATAASASATGANPSAAPNTTAPPAARMRRAIGAYLACAREFSAARPMLTAVA